MKDLRHLKNDIAFQKRLKDFSDKHFIKRNKNLLTNKSNPKFPNKYLENVWSELKSQFRDKQNFRCAICENEITLRSDSSIDVEHYRYKNHYWWLAYNPQNYYLCCDDCNRVYKGEKFPLDGGESSRVTYDTRKEIGREVPLLLNLFQENPLEYFEIHFLLNAQTSRGIAILRPKEGIDNLFLKKAKATIETFNLDLHSQRTATDNTRCRLLEHFFKILIDVAIKRNQLSQKDFIEYLKKEIEESKKHNSNIQTLDLLKLILLGNFKIHPKYLTNSNPV